MAKPTYSIIIPTLNEEKFLPNLLKSLTNQTQKDFEVIVVDGSSKDATVTLAKRFVRKLPLLTILVSKKASLPLQRNMGAKQARGPWLLFIDADSILVPFFFERIEEFIKTAHPALFTSWFCPDSDERSDAMLALLANFFLEGSVMVHRQLAPGPLTAVSRKHFDMVKGYDEDHAFNEDMDFSLRLYRRGIELQIIRETLCVLSLRRLRTQGMLKVIQQYLRASLHVLFFNKTMKQFPGYIMGGQLYDKKNQPLKRSFLKQYRAKLKKLAKELFS